MANQHDPEHRQDPGARRPEHELRGRGDLMGESAVPRDPDTGAAGTTNPRAAVPAASAKPTGVVPPGPNRTRWLVLAGFAVIGIILILLLVT